MIVGIIDEGINGDVYPVAGGLARVDAQQPGTAPILPERHVGELRERAPFLAEGYFANPEATARAFSRRLVPDRRSRLSQG